MFQWEKKKTSEQTSTKTLKSRHQTIDFPSEFPSVIPHDITGEIASPSLGFQGAGEVTGP
jgi:hypothetical protein